MTFNEKLGTSMRKARKKKGYTIQNVAEKMNLAKTTISAYELGKITISTENFLLYCQAIEFNYVDILDSSSNKL